MSIEVAALSATIDWIPPPREGTSCFRSFAYFHENSLAITAATTDFMQHRNGLSIITELGVAQLHEMRD